MNMKTHVGGLGLLIAGLGAGAVLAGSPEDGYIDSTWHVAGKVTVGFQPGGVEGEDSPSSVVLGPDGSLYASGISYDHIGPDGKGRIAIAKRDPAGGIDTDFSGDGKLLVSVPDIVSSAGIPSVFQPVGPGYLLVAAARTTVNDLDVIVCRINAKTGLMTGFSNPNEPIQGCTTAPLKWGRQRVAELLMQPDGKFIVVGTHAWPQNPGAKFVYATRFNADGSVDNSFDGSPKRNGLIYDDHDVRAAALTEDGDIIVVGESKTTFSAGRTGLVMRIGSDGTLQQEQGFHLTDPSRHTTFLDVIVEPRIAGGDTLVVAGTVKLTEDKYSGLIARFRNSESLSPTLDHSFNGTGFSTLTIQDSFQYNTVAAHPCVGYLVAGGAPFFDQSGDMVVHNWSRDGVRNLGFSGTGTSAIDIYSAADQDDWPLDMVVDGDGVYVVGRTTTPLGDWNFGMAKLFMDSLYCNGFAGYGLE